MSLLDEFQKLKYKFNSYKDTTVSHFELTALKYLFMLPGLSSFIHVHSHTLQLCNVSSVLNHSLRTSCTIKYNLSTICVPAYVAKVHVD